MWASRQWYSLTYFLLSVHNTFPTGKGGTLFPNELTRACFHRISHCNWGTIVLTDCLFHGVMECWDCKVHNWCWYSAIMLWTGLEVVYPEACTTCWVNSAFQTVYSLFTVARVLSFGMAHRFWITWQCSGTETPSRFSYWRWMRTVNILYGSCFAEYSVSCYLQACPGMTFYNSVLHVQFSAFRW